MQVIFTPRAMRHVSSLHHYLTENASEQVADRFIGRIVTKCQALSDFPMRGSRRDDILAGLRILGVARRVVIAFMIMPDTVLIEGIFYGGRNYEAELRAPSEDVSRA